jgi:hypothetical protein
VKTHDLNFLVGPDDDDVCALYLPRAVVLENVLESRDYLLLLRGSDCFDDVLVFVFHLLSFLDVYMSRLNDILLMHRCDVIGIFLIVI